MSSLSYLDEHMAWQQRVHKEVSMASGFLNLFDRTQLQSKATAAITMRPIKREKRLFSSTEMPKINQSLMSTNVHAEVRGKYARAPRLNNVRPTTCSNGGNQSFLKEAPNRITKHVSILEQRRRRFKNRNHSASPIQTEMLDKDIQELTRLLKIERLKRLIVQKRLES